MKNIEEFIKNCDDYDKIVIQKSFKSKKNTVAYVTIDNKPRVLKFFVPGLKENMEKEYQILEKGKKLNIPNVYKKDDKNNFLTMNYIAGENLCDVINDKKTTFKEKKRLMELLAEWFNNFHNHFKTDEEFFIRGDSNLRNFILNDQIWGLDLEETRKGQPTEDIADLCSSILTTDPMFTNEKYSLCKKLITSYVEKAPGRVKNIDLEVSYSILKKIQYRPEDEEILRKHAKKIRKHGL